MDTSAMNRVRGGLSRVLRPAGLLLFLLTEVLLAEGGSLSAAVALAATAAHAAPRSPPARSSAPAAPPRCPAPGCAPPCATGRSAPRSSRNGTLTPRGAAAPEPRATPS